MAGRFKYAGRALPQLLLLAHHPRTVTDQSTSAHLRKPLRQHPLRKLEAHAVDPYRSPPLAPARLVPCSTSPRCIPAAQVDSQQITVCCHPWSSKGSCAEPNSAPMWFTHSRVQRRKAPGRRDYGQNTHMLHVPRVRTWGTDCKPR